MIPHWMARTNVLLGEEQVERLMKANVLVVGLGGVGGIAAEMIARAGVGKMTIVDADTVDPTNRNRQIPALSSTENMLKAEVLAARLRDINPEIEITVINEYVKDTRTDEILDAQKYDYALDCIDTLSPKVYFIKACLDRGVPFVSSMGAGGKIDPTQLKVADISKSHSCHLAKYVRKRLHRLGIFHGVVCVYSTEKTDTSRVIATPDDTRKKSVIGTISYLPAVFGCTVASVAIRDIASGRKKRKW